MDLVADIRSNVIEGNAPATLELVKQALTQGIPAERILNEGLIAAMRAVADRLYTRWIDGLDRS